MSFPAWPAPPPQPRAPRFLGVPRPGVSRHVLLVDDELVVRSWSEALAREGSTVLSTESAEEAMLGASATRARLRSS